MFVKPFVMSYLLQEHLKLICQKTINSIFFNVYIDGRCDKVFKKINVSELKCFFRKWPIDNCHVVSFKLHPG